MPPVTTINAIVYTFNSVSPGIGEFRESNGEREKERKRDAKGIAMGRFLARCSTSLRVLGRDKEFKLAARGC